MDSLNETNTSGYSNNGPNTHVWGIGSSPVGEHWVNPLLTLTFKIQVNPQQKTCKPTSVSHFQKLPVHITQAILLFNVYSAGANLTDAKILIASLLCKIHPCSQFLWLQCEVKILMKFHPPKIKTFCLTSISIKVNLSFCGSQCNLEYRVCDI
jgi:hypothetical protein